MSYLKRLGLAFSAIAFVMSMFAVTSFAQRSYRERSYQDRDSYWQNNNYRRYRRSSRMSEWRYRQIMRERARYYRRANRYYGNYDYSNNGYNRRRYAGRNYQNRRNVYVYRRNW